MCGGGGEIPVCRSGFEQHIRRNSPVLLIVQTCMPIYRRCMCVYIYIYSLHSSRYIEIIRTPTYFRQTELHIAFVVDCFLCGNTTKIVALSYYYQSEHRCATSRNTMPDSDKAI